MPSEPTAAASAARDPHATIAMLRHALDRMPGNADAMVGLAGVHLQLGLLDDAAQWCAKAVAVAPEQKAANRVRAAVGEAFVKRGTHQAIDGQLDLAIDTLSRAASLTESRSVALFRDLFRLARRWFDDAAALPLETGAICLSIPVWGESYVAAACENLFRSLLAPGNVPALAQQAAVKIEISTRESDRQALERSPVIAALRRHADISFFIIPNHLAASGAPPDFGYWLMSVAHYASAERARRSGAGVSFLTADMVLSDGSLRAACRLVAEGAAAVLIRALELDREALRRGTDNAAPALAVAPDALVSMALAQVGASLPGGWSGIGSTSFNIGGCGWFPIDGGVALYGFHFLPLLMSAELIGRRFTFDFLTVDTRCVRLALGDEAADGRIKVVDDSNDIAVVSTMRAERDAPGPCPLDAERLGSWAAGWCFAPADIAYFDWCLRHRIIYRPGRTDTAPAPAAAERAFLAATLDAYAGTASAHVANPPRA